MSDHDYQPSLDPNNQGDCAICGHSQYMHAIGKTYTEAEVKALIAAAAEGAIQVFRKTQEDPEYAKEPWPQEEVSPGVMRDVDPESLFRALTPADAKAALDRMLQEREQRGRNGALREAADEWLNVRAEGRLVMAALIAYSDRIRAMIEEAPHDPA